MTVPAWSDNAPRRLARTDVEREVARSFDAIAVSQSLLRESVALMARCAEVRDEVAARRAEVRLTRDAMAARAAEQLAGVAVRGVAVRGVAVQGVAVRPPAGGDAPSPPEPAWGQLVHGRAVSTPTPHRAARRDEMVKANMPLAKSVARRFANRGEMLDDLEQVAMLGLVKAVDRYEEDRGVSFSTFAVATMVGELKRHFRDRRWSVHLTRGAQERYLRVRDTTDRLVVELGRSPTVAEVAEAAGLTPEDVIEGREASHALRPSTLDAPAGPDAAGSVQLAGDDRDMDVAEARMTVAALLPRLSERERLIVSLRFVDRLTQAEIGAKLGLSQMHVSRLLQKSIEQMRAWVLAG